MGNSHTDLIAVESDGGLMTVATVAKLLAVARSTVYVLMDSGRLPYVKLGRARRVSRRAVAELINDSARGGWMVPGRTGTGAK